MSYPPAASIDIETYGNCLVNNAGSSLPPQNFFHPSRSLLQDKVALSDLILTVSLTFPKEAPKHASEWCPHTLAALEPGDTMVFQMSDPSHVSALIAHIERCHTLFGMNMLFDIPFMRALPRLRDCLNGTHTIIDLAVINYLEDETRTERSLKDIGGVIGTHSYDELPDRFPRPDHQSHVDYNAQDTHNTLVDIATLAARIVDKYPDSPKLSQYCINFYSDVIWSCVRMEEAGTPISRPLALSMKHRLLKEADEATLQLKNKFGITVSGEGSQKSKLEYFQSLCTYIEEKTTLAQDTLGCSLYDAPLFSLTPKKQEVSVAKLNRIVVQKLLPDNHPAQEALALWTTVESNKKLISSYLDPFLVARKPGKKHIHSTKFISHSSCENPGTILGFPKIYMVPSSFKDSRGDDGGQVQTRLSFTDPAVPTFPKQIKKLESSRFKKGVIFGADLSQIELRMAALLSGEESLLRAFNDGEDPHTNRAQEVYGIPNLIKKYGEDYISDDGFRSLERQCGKHGNFTDLNWGGPSVLQRTILLKGDLLVPMSFCREIVNSRPYVRPKLFDYQVKFVEEAHRNEIVTLPFIGQSRHFRGGIRFEDPRRRDDLSYMPLKGANKPNDVVNFPIQALAAATMLEIINYVSKKMPSLSTWKPPAYIFACVYDALYFDTRPNLVPELRGLFAEAATYVQDHGLWAKLIGLYGHGLPLEFDFDHIAGPTSYAA